MGMAMDWKSVKGGDLGAGSPAKSLRLLLVLEDCSRFNIHPYAKIEFFVIGNIIFYK